MNDVTSAGSARRDLSARASLLLAASGSAGERRAFALARALAGRPAPPAPGFADVAAAPDWLLQDRPGLHRVARRAALFSMAEDLAGCIDGARLAALADAAGPDALDQAIAAAETAGPFAMDPVEAGALDARGFALMEAALPPPLQSLLAWAERERDAAPGATRAAACLAAVEGATR